MNRFQEAEALAATVRAELPRVAVQWLAAARPPLEKLTRAALDPDLSNAEFLALVEDFSRTLPTLFDQLDHTALATHMENSMGAAMANGIAGRVKGLKVESLKVQDSSSSSSDLRPSTFRPLDL